MKIYEIKDKMVGEWNSEVKAMIDTWTDYFHVTLEQFRNSIFETGLNYAKSNGCIAWIVDSSNAKGVFAQDIQKFLSEEGFNLFKNNGIKYFISISSNASPITKMTVNRYKSEASKSGLEQIELNSVSDAILWLKHNAK